MLNRPALRHLRFAAFALAGPLAAFLAIAGLPAPAEAANCGALNQRPCTIIQRIPSCDSGLVEDFSKNLCVRQAAPPTPKPLNCGALNQRPCTVVERIPSCNNGLIEDFAKGRCVQPNTQFDQIRRDAEAKARRLAPIIRDLAVAMGPLSNAQTLAQLTQLINARKPEDVRRIVEGTPRIANTYRLLRELGFNTMTVGIASSGAVLYGRALETGASLDTNRQRPPRMYQSKVELAGIQVQVGNDLVMSGYISPNDAIGGHAYGATGEFDVGTGTGVTLWYNDRTLALIGFSVGMGIGSAGGGGAFLDSNTTVY